MVLPQKRLVDYRSAIGLADAAEELIDIIHSDLT